MIARIMTNGRERVKTNGRVDLAYFADLLNIRGRWRIRFWRREWDSNPRYGFPYTRFPSVRLQPLGHPSAKAESLRRAHYSRGTPAHNPFPRQSLDNTSPTIRSPEPPSLTHRSHDPPIAAPQAARPVNPHWC